MNKLFKLIILSLLLSTQIFPQSISRLKAKKEREKSKRNKMLRIKIYNVVLLLTILMCIHVHIRLTISVTPGKRMNNIAFRQLKLHQAKTTYDLVHAAANEKKTLRRKT